MLSSKRFTSKDTNGCEFICQAWYSRDKIYDFEKQKFVVITDDIYEAIGLNVKANSLKDLKEKVASL